MSTTLFEQDTQQTAGFPARHDKRFIIGIDPGQSGGIAVLGAALQEASKMPETEHDIVALLREYQATAAHMGLQCACYIELVHGGAFGGAARKMGVSSAFTFGKGYGVLIGILAALGIPYEFVTPQKWQKALGCMSKGDKNVTKARAQQLFPHIPKITHYVADALLIAEFGRRQSG